EKPPEPPPPPVKVEPASAPPRTRSRRRRIALAVALVFVSMGAIATALTNVERRVDPSRVVEAEAPVLVVGPIRVRTIYRDDAGFGVGVVDSSWYQATGRERKAAAISIAADERLKGSPAVSIRDYGGRTLAGVRE